MVSSRKRGRQEMEAVEPPPPPPKERSLIERIRNMWEFANLAQWIFMFGSAVKLDENLDVEELEMEFLKSQSTVLPEIGLALLKFVSSHRGLTPEIFDEYTRRQYVAKAPRRNPFGTEEQPAAFVEFDVFTKIRVLQQLSQWTMGNPDRIRERMEEQRDIDQTIWRIEPFGWDQDDRTYYVLDDNRLYRRTDAPPIPVPAAKPKKNSKKAKAALRASKRRKVSEPVGSEAEATEDVIDGHNQKAEIEDDGFGGMKWECIAITLDEFNAFTTSIEKSRDPNEKSLRKNIMETVLPLLEKQEESRKRKAAQKERELLNMEKLATAKRSSRIRGKVEQQKHEEELREAERKKQAELAMAKKEQEKWLKLEKERESRMQTREQRVKEREARRILHEEELANLSEDSKKLETGAGRLSERHLKAEIEKKKQALEELAEEEDWIFDCICGAYGQIDDGTHSIACDICNIWQHSKCVGVKQADADRDDFTFVCTTCQRRARDEERAKTHPPIKIKLSRPGSSSSAMTPKSNGSQAIVIKPSTNGEQLGTSPQKTSPSQAKQNQPKLASWSTKSPTSKNPLPGPDQLSPKHPQLLNGHQHYQPSNHTGNFSMQLPGSAYTGPYNGLSTNGVSGSTPQQSFSRPSSAHAFSSPHPHSPTNLPPPMQPQTYTFVNGNSHGAQGSQTQIHKTPSHPSMQATPSQSYQNGSRPSSSDGGQRRGSIHLPSPLASAPVLTPSHKQYQGSNSPASSPVGNNLSAAHSITSSSPPSHLQHSALPPSTTGFSPTKHATPRAQPNGNLSSPTMLPPVTSLLPSPQLQNLTPPVKSSEGEWNGAASQPLTQ